MYRTNSQLNELLSSETKNMTGQVFVICDYIFTHKKCLKQGQIKSMHRSTWASASK